MQNAQDIELIDPKTFMKDKNGLSHWIGNDATLDIEGSDLFVSNGDLKTQFNFKAHCRRPLRTINNAAEKYIKTHNLEF
ncbi:MAG: hypothetical protein AAF182_00925 [Pseudomonadota bacterium]